LSTGIVNGRQQLVHGNIRWDRAIRLSSSDREIADKLLAEFKTSFNITKATVISMKKLGKNEESYVRFQLMQNVEDHGPISEVSMTDFLTTVRTQRVHHVPFQHHPEQSGSWPINTFTDSPSLLARSTFAGQVHLCWPGPHLRWPRSPASLLATNFLATTVC
jgi:hypothetical protein